MKKTLSLLLFFLFSGVTDAQSLQLDPTFNSADTGFDHGKGFETQYNGYVNCSVVQPDGKIIIGGHYSRYNDVNVAASAGGKPFRINTDGSIDSSFNLNITSQSPTLDISAMALQPDGKVILIGNFSFYVGADAFNRKIIRLNADGSADSSFMVGIASNPLSLNDCLVQPDGKILLVGKFNTVQGISANCIARLNGDGTRDTAFNAGGNGPLFGYNENSINRIKLQSDGKIIIVGNFGAYNGVARRNIARLNADGTLDTAFDPGSGFNQLGITTNPPLLNSLTMQPDGKLLVGGQFYGYNGAAQRSLVRINTDGSVDNTFATGLGISFLYVGPSGGGDSPGRVNATVVLDDGRIVVGGSFQKYNGVPQNSIICLHADGSLDTTFNSGTGVYRPDGSYWSPDDIQLGGVHALNILSNQKILVSGKFESYDNTFATYITKIDSGGNLDLSFNATTGFDEAVECSAIQPNGKILVGGYFTKYNNTIKRGLVRLNTDGSIDNSFDIGSGINTTNVITETIDQLWVKSVVLQPDGKIIISGYFESFNGVAKNSIVRLNADGTIDAGFTLAPTIASEIYSGINKVVLQPDGKILLVGNYTDKMYRINSNGSIDASFTPATQASDVFFLLPDGKIIYNFASYSLKRLNANGTLDTSFSPVSCGNLYAIDVQTDNKIIIAGDFTNVNGSSVPKIARLNPDGTLDFGFYLTGTTNISNVNAVKVMANDKILISGTLSPSNNPAFLYRLGSGGVVETSFSDLQINRGTSDFPGITNINIQASGAIYVGGSFISFGTDGRNRFARLTEGALGVEDFGTTQELKIYPNPTASMLTIDVKADCEINVIQIFNIMGQKVLMLPNTMHQKTIDVSNLKSGTYLIKMDTSYGTFNKSFIKE